MLRYMYHRGDSELREGDIICTCKTGQCYMTNGSVARNLLAHTMERSVGFENVDSDAGDMN